MADKQVGLSIVISAKDSASRVIRRVGAETEALSRSMNSSLGKAGKGWGSLAKGVDMTGGMISAIAPAMTGPMMILGTAAKAVLGVFATMGNLAGRVFSAIGSAIRSVISAALDLGKRALSFVIDKFKELQRVAQIALLAAAAALGALGVASAKAASEMETALVAFTTMLKSADAAKQFMAELKAFAAATPFEFSQLTDIAKQFMAFGFQAQEIIPMLRDIGDAIGGLGGGAETMDRVVRAFGQMRAKGKVQAEELLQLAEAGIPVYEILRQKIGMTSDEISKAAQAGDKARNSLTARDVLRDNGYDPGRALGDKGGGGLSPETAINAIREGLRERFGGGMVAQMGTAEGMVSNLQDAFFELKAAIGAALLPALKAVVPVLSQMMSTLSRGAGPAMDKLLGFLRQLGNSAAAQSIIYNIGYALSSLYAVFLRPEGGVGGWVQALVDRVAAALQWLVTNVLNPTSLGQIKEWLAGLYGAITGWLGQAFAWLSGKVGWMRAWANWLVEAIQWAARGAGEWLQWLYQVVQQAWPQIVKTFQDAWTAIDQVLDSMVDSLPRVLEMLVNFGAGVMHVGSVIADAMWEAFHPFASADELLARDISHTQAIEGWKATAMEAVYAIENLQAKREEMARQGVGLFDSGPGKFLGVPTPDIGAPPPMPTVPAPNMRAAGWAGRGGNAYTFNFNSPIYGVDQLKQAIYDGIRETEDAARYQ